MLRPPSPYGRVMNASGQVMTVLVLVLGFALCAGVAVWTHRRLRHAPPEDRRRALIVGALTGAIIVVVLATFRLLNVPGY